MRAISALFSILGLILTQGASAGSPGPQPFPLKHPLYCEFWTGNQLLTLPDAYMIYEPSTQTVFTRSRTGIQSYHVTPIVGPEPYYNHGYVLTIFGDVPVLSISDKCFDTIPVLAYLLDNHEATWGKVPGFPATLNAGLCFEHPLFPEDFVGW
jgi:hypothetical protein